MMDISFEEVGQRYDLPEGWFEDIEDDFGPVLQSFPEESIEKILFDRFMSRIALEVNNLTHQSHRSQMEVLHTDIQVIHLKAEVQRQQQQLEGSRDTIKELLVLLRRSTPTLPGQQYTLTKIHPELPPSAAKPEKRSHKTSTACDLLPDSTTASRPKHCEDSPAADPKKLVDDKRREHKMRYRRYWRVAPRYRRIA